MINEISRTTRSRTEEVLYLQEFTGDIEKYAFLFLLFEIDY